MAEKSSDDFIFGFLSEGISVNLKERQTRGWQTVPWPSLFYPRPFKVRELRRLLHFSNVVKIKQKKKKKDLGLRGLYPAKPKIFTIWCFRVKRLPLLSLASMKLLHEPEILSAHAGESSVIKTSVVFRLFYN